jgi:hypothetical protein
MRTVVFLLSKRQSVFDQVRHSPFLGMYSRVLNNVQIWALRITRRFPDQAVQLHLQRSEVPSLGALCPQ